MGWRDHYKVHPAADVFPLLPDDELRKLGEDIKQNGLKENVMLYAHKGELVVLDGRNRLDAMELVGMTILENQSARNAADGKPNAGEWALKNDIASMLLPDVDPYTFSISKNIHRRHLTKEQQADMIVRVLKQKELVEPARSFSPNAGKRGGSTKDPVKAAAVEEGKKHGISKRTVEKSIAKARGPVQKPRPKKESPPKTVTYHRGGTPNGQSVTLPAAPQKIVETKSPKESDNSKPEWQQKLASTLEPLWKYPELSQAECIERGKLWVVSGPVNRIARFVHDEMNKAPGARSRHELAIEIQKLANKVERVMHKQKAEARKKASGR